MRISKGYQRSLELNLNKGVYQFITAQQKCLLDLNEDSNLHFDPPSYVTNSILEFNTKSIEFINHLSQAIDIFEGLNCKHVALKINGEIKSSSLKKIVQLINDSNIHKTDFYFEFTEFLYSDLFVNLLCHTIRLGKVFIFNAPFDKNLEDLIFYFKSSFKPNYNKEAHEFRCNKTLYTESLSYHTYFNRKIYIGPNGEIKNAPECEDSLGFIEDLNSLDDIKEIILTPPFQKYWFVHKDLCDVCKHCEFRHMCVDNRVPFERSEIEWYHKIECNYNPFIAKWEGEPGYKTLEECGVVSNDKMFSIDQEKIQQINHEIWGE
jgi:hypothetical protein